MLVFTFFGYLKKSDLLEVSTDELLSFTFGINFFENQIGNRTKWLTFLT